MLREDTTRREELGTVGITEIGHADMPFPLYVYPDKPTEPQRYKRTIILYEERDDLGTPYIFIERFNVIAVKHNRNWPGTDTDTLFAVEAIGRKDQFYGVCVMWGFHTEQEAFEFLSGHGSRVYHSFDQQGNPLTETRKRLGIPDSYIHRYAEVVA